MVMSSGLSGNSLLQGTRSRNWVKSDVEGALGHRREDICMDLIVNHQTGTVGILKSCADNFHELSRSNFIVPGVTKL